MYCAMYGCDPHADEDSDDDGIKDVNYTLNEGSIRALIKGSDLKNLGINFRVTYLSEQVYQEIKYYIGSPVFDDKHNDELIEYFFNNTNSFISFSRQISQSASI